MTTSNTITRRGALAGMSATAAVAASGASIGIAQAGTPASAYVPLTTREIGIAWPVWNHLDPSSDGPGVGERITLERVKINDDLDRAIAVRAENGRRLGYVPRDEAADIVSAIDRGISVPARVTKRAEASLASPNGWAVLGISIEPQSAFV